MNETDLRMIETMLKKQDELNSAIMKEFGLTTISKEQIDMATLDEIGEFTSMCRILYVYIVWKNKTLQNWKYLLSTNLPDSMYYELTYNGDKKEWYLDAYRKVENQCISEETMIAELKRRGLM